MKLLLISDHENSFLWDYYVPGRLDGIDLILSCGDLKPEYLSFLVTMGRAPVLYVCGNHDGRYERTPPEGCDCIEDKLVTIKGLRILGMGTADRISIPSGRWNAVCARSGGRSPRPAASIFCSATRPPRAWATRTTSRTAALSASTISWTSTSRSTMFTATCI